MKAKPSNASSSGDRKHSHRRSSSSTFLDARMARMQALASKSMQIGFRMAKLEALDLASAPKWSGFTMAGAIPSSSWGTASEPVLKKNKDDTVLTESDTMLVNETSPIDTLQLTTKPVLNDTMTNDALHNDISTLNEPSFFVSIASMFNEVDNGDITENCSQLDKLEKQASMLNNIVSEECEDGEFIPPSMCKVPSSLNAKKAIFDSSKVNSNGPQDDNFQYVSRKKSKQSKHVLPATPRSTRAQSSSKVCND
ncbi:hypothetical protein MA16_Dca008740 [Dendrobium catenatum]|uniref:Uncharacterized protein n=1 Tax=Dendrobium catenatum TaxID=906689 RepID=A0A2I0W4N7_9ASPA|nr:hypothetical protein MA16_Dca008740 [Dendrobium catenatum]